MPAIQPIPRNAPDSRSIEAAAVLALHNRSTDARVRNPASWAPATRRGGVPGENPGRRVR